MTAIEVPDADIPESERHRTSRRRPRTRVVAALIVLALVAVGVGAVAWWSRRSADPPPVASSVTCPVYWQASDTVQPIHAGDLTAQIAHPALGDNEQTVTAGAMTVKVAVPNIDPGFHNGPGGDLSLDVTDSKGRRMYHQLFQIWQGPVNEFGGNTGFTGLLYISDPETGAIVQLSCTAT